jgi:hypothetical protein
VLGEPRGRSEHRAARGVAGSTKAAAGYVTRSYAAALSCVSLAGKQGGLRHWYARVNSGWFKVWSVSQIAI